MSRYQIRPEPPEQYYVVFDAEIGQDITVRLPLKTAEMLVDKLNENAEKENSDELLH